METIKRNIAYKLKIGSLFHGKTIIDGERLKFLELGDKKVVKVNIVANIIEKFLTEDSRYLNFTIDDASGQIRLKIFGSEETKRFSSLSQGDTIMAIGNLKLFRNELYLSPDIIKKIDPRYLMVRKLELKEADEKSLAQSPAQKIELKAVRDQIIEIIKNAEKDNGLDTEKLIMEISADPSLINAEIKKLLEEGLAFEPRPGRIRYLGS